MKLRLAVLNVLFCLVTAQADTNNLLFSWESNMCVCPCASKPRYDVFLELSREQKAMSLTSPTLPDGMQVASSLRLEFGNLLPSKEIIRVTITVDAYPHDLTTLPGLTELLQTYKLEHVSIQRKD